VTYGRRLILLWGLSLSASRLPASPVPPSLLPELHWRMIGPHRGGRTVAAVGIPNEPSVFYIGVNNGGVWKTSDYGRVWRPIFDDQPTGSIGAVAVAPSNPQVIYVGTGEGLQRPDLSTGDGIYRSSDGGKTWTHLGLRDAQQIPAILVDPSDPDRLFAAVLGHPYGPNPDRGIFRSRDGGRTFEKVLYQNEDVGGMDLAFEPGNPDVVYAVLWESRQAPWENGVFKGTGSGLFKSTDGGTTWRPLAGGLPGASNGLGRIGLGTCASAPKRLYAVVDAVKIGGIYRSDDGGESWRRVNEDPRLWSRDGDFDEIRADPKNPDVVYVANVVTWKSIDGGKTFTAFRGAPGGDDYHRLWINPIDPRTIILAGDQGAIVTVNGGETWSSWYNQPTAQFYHVAADNAFPYRVCGGQQESGSACVSSRGEFGQITYRDWRPVGVEEYGYAAPDPLDPDIVYGGRLTRFDRRTGQVQDIAPSPLRRDGYRVLRTAPVVFSPTDPKVLYFASERVWKTADGGRSWVAVSPDLSRKDWAVPANVGKYATQARPTRRGVIYTLAPSPVDPNRIWVGTDDGLIHVTTDAGSTWTDVTPPQLVPWAKVSLMDASHFDALTAYAAINTLRLDDLRPHIYRTRDGGKTWTHITDGIPDGGTVNVVREDPQRRGLLFAGTEREVFVSSDDGDHWQSLRLNMPTTSIRDLVVKDADLVVATHGRSFWILDDIAPLRQMDASVVSASSFLFRPQAAFRVRWNTNTDTPLPQEEPAGQNPPDGAVVDYYLRAPAKGPVVLEFLEPGGQVVGRFSSADAPLPLPAGRNIPDYWIRPPQRPSNGAGLHRFVWDLHSQPPPAVLEFEYPIAAVYGDTPLEPRGPWVLPGDYTVRLTVDGQTESQPLTVRMDPRVKTSPTDLKEQYSRSMQVSQAIGRARDALGGVGRLRQELRRRAPLGGSLREAIAKVEQRAQELEGPDADSPAASGQVPGLKQLLGDLASLYQILQGADAAPTPQAASAVSDLERALATRLASWADLKAHVKELSDELRKAGLPSITP
jgi:photosystem II stability/assembly factor-like uncharacterized protein